MMKKALSFLSVFMVLAAVCGFTPSYADTVSFEFDNDIIIPNKLNTNKRHSDDDYSNGVRFDYLRQEWGFALGQSMYTPMDLQTTENQIGDRQYAGYLYFEVNYRRNPLEFYALQIGFIGKNSLAEETQDLVHKWLSCKKPLGWDNQIDGHGVEAEVIVKKMFWLYHNDWYYLTPTLTGSAGSVNVIGSVGLFQYFALGGYMPGYDTGLPVVEIRGVSPFKSYLMMGVDCDFVAYNYFLDADESTVDKKPVVFEGLVGAGFTWHGFGVDFNYCLRSKEYDQQRNLAHFGIVKFRYTF